MTLFEFMKRFLVGTCAGLPVTVILLVCRLHAGEVRMTTVINNPAAPPGQAVLGPPQFDSNWQPINQSQSLRLDLLTGSQLSGDPQNYVVYLVGRRVNNAGRPREAQTSKWTGGHFRNDGLNVGLLWKRLEGGRINVDRRPNDDSADQYRVRIWEYSTS